MKVVDIGLFASNYDKSKFTQYVENCDYYAVALPCYKPDERHFMLFGADIKTNIRIVRAEEIKHFMESSKMIIQNGDSVAMNFNGVKETTDEGNN